MEGCITDVRKTLVEKLLNKVIEKSRYLFCFTCIVKEFNEEKDKLQAESATMREQFQVANNKGKGIKTNAQFWEEQANKLIQENIETKQRYYFGFCPDCFWRYKRGEELATKTKVIKSLMEKGEKFENIEITRGLPGVERYSSQYYISFKSRELKCKELLDALKDDSNYMVGLHGMGGSGKTTLAKEVGKQLKIQEHFKYVIDTTVSLNLDIKKIQDDIAGSLGLEWGDINESDRPKRLWTRLTNGEKILLILDDVWEYLKFDDIGIPNSDNHKGCKVLVTTRNLGVCNKMGCGKTIQLELLTEEDAWIMFKKHADLSNISSKSILDKGRKIAIECKRLPVAIATIASSLKGLNSREEWDVVLNSLKKPVSMGNVDDELVDIFKCLKFSYDYLKDERAKGLFLLCSAFPEDKEISVELLTRLGIGVNLFGEDYDKYNDARSQAIVAKNKLLHSCLLLETEKGDVKMHDLVREVAQWIAKEEILVVNLFEKNQKSLLERSKNIKYLFFQGKLMDLFSSTFDSSKLEILIAKTFMDDSKDVPTSLFENMVWLRVLILRNPLSLPKSVQLLMNIRFLSLKNLNLGDISVLGSLQRLETLELHSCEIDEFSREIAKLDKLRLLCLKECEIKRNNPFEVIQSFPSLEELYFWDSFNDLCQEITLPTLERYLLIDDFSYWNGSQSKGVALEGDRLSEATYKYVMKTSYYLHLIRIQGWINLMPEMVPIDQGMNDLIEFRLREISQLQCLVDTKHINSQVPIVFSKLVVLKLKRMINLEELCNGPISFDSMNNLEKLSIKECENLRSLFELSTSQCLPLLEELKIIDCQKLENIITFERRVIEESANGYNDKKSCYSLFPKLKVLQIERCHQLQFVLPILSARDLEFLEVIKIRCCDKLKYIFGQHQDVKLTSLKTVRIEDLPNFIDIFPTNASSISKDGSKPQTQLDLVKSNTFSMCCYRYKLKSTKVPLVYEDQPQQCSISLDSNSYCLDIWEPAQCLLRQSHILCNTIEIGIYNFPKIKSVFIQSIAPIMLETLTIKDCEELKQIIIDSGDHNSISGNNFGNVFPKLKRLHVEDCVQLEYIFELKECSQLASGDFITTTSMDGTVFKELIDNEESGQQMNLSLEFIELIDLPMMRCLFVGLKYSFVLNNLAEMHIHRCEKLEIVFSTSVLRCLPQLVTLAIIECKELKHIIEDDLEDKISRSSNTFFPKLKTLIVTKCDKLKYVFPVSICKEFPELKFMLIREADELEEIFKSDKKDEVEEISKSDVQIPNLKAVGFANLPSLCHAQEVHFQAVKHRFVHSCQKLSLTSCNESDSNCDRLDFWEDYDAYCHFHSIRECKEAVSEHKLTSPQELMNEQLMDQQCLMNQPHPLGEIDTTIKPSQEYNLEGSTSEITAAATVSTITETKNKLPTQEVGPKQKGIQIFGIQIFVEEETTSANAKTITSSTHLDAVGSSSGQLVTSLLEGPTSEITAAETVSTITETKNKPRDIRPRVRARRRQATGPHSIAERLRRERMKALQELVPSINKCIEINVEEGTASANAKTITSSTHLDVAGSSSGQLVTSEYKTSSKEDDDSQIAMASFSTSTTETNDQSSLNHDSCKKVSSNIAEQFPKDDDIIVSKSIPSPSIKSPVVYQVPPVPCKEELFKGDNAGDENPSAETTKDFAAGSEVQEASEHKLTSPQELMNEQLMDQQCLMNHQQTLAETDITIKPSQEENLEGPASEITAAAATVSTITHEVVPKQKGIEINVEEGNTSANAKTITSSTHSGVAGSSSGQLVTSEYKTSSQEDVDSQIAMTSFSVSTSETKDQGSLNHDSVKKVSLNIEDDDITVSKSKPSLSITSPVVYQFPPVPCKEEPSQKVEDLSSLLVKSELEQLVSKNHLDCGNLSLLTDFFDKHPSVYLKDTSLSNRYKGCAYNLLAELLKFLKTHNVLEVLGSFHSEFLELLQDARSFGFDKDWLDGVERRALFPDIQVSQDALQKLLDFKQQVTKDVEGLRLKIGILSQQLTSSEAVLESIIQQEVVLSAPIGY